MTAFAADRCTTVAGHATHEPMIGNRDTLI